MAGIRDSIRATTKWRIYRFKDPRGEVAAFMREGHSLGQTMLAFPGAFIGDLRVDGNLCLNEGLQEMIDLTYGLGSPITFSNANAHVGVGDGDTAVAATDTGLSGSNKCYMPMDVGYPQRSGQTVKLRATFGPSDGNFYWKEFTAANGNSDTAKNMNRKLADKGLKEPGETWSAEVDITYT